MNNSSHDFDSKQMSLALTEQQLVSSGERGARKELEECTFEPNRDVTKVKQKDDEVFISKQREQMNEYIQKRKKKIQNDKEMKNIKASGKFF